MSSTTTLPPPAGSTVGPVDLLDWMRREVASLVEVLWGARRPAEQLDTVAEIERLRSTLDAVQLVVVGEVEATDAAKTEGWGSTRDFVTAVAGGHKATGPALVRLAKDLAEWPRVLGALAAGAISRTQAQVIVRTLHHLPTDHGLRTQAEELLLAEAAVLDATDLDKAGRHLVTVLDPDGDDRETERKLDREERAAHLRRFLSIREDGMGGVRITGRTTVEDAAVIKAALSPLAAPEPSSDPADVTGGCAGQGRDPRDHGARFLDALVEGCRRLLGAEVLPGGHGATPRVTLTMSLADLVDVVGVGTLETGESLSASAVRRLACDADVIPVVLGGHGEVLDVGRTQRLVAAAIWKALVARDGHCTFPGCRRPPIACDAHHLVHWAEGGGTGLDNLALLCRAHHTTIHHTPWQIRLNPRDRRPEFIPPPHLDPERRPTRTRALRPLRT